MVFLKECRRMAFTLELNILMAFTLELNIHSFGL